MYGTAKIPIDRYDHLKMIEDAFDKKKILYKTRLESFETIEELEAVELLVKKNKELEILNNKRTDDCNRYYEELNQLNVIINRLKNRSLIQRIFNK